MASQIVRVDALRSVDAGNITGSYIELGGAFEHPMRVIKLTNNTDSGLLISFDNINDNIFMPAGSFTLYDVTTNKENNATYFVFANGTQIFVKSSTAPTTGAIYLECLYGQGE